MEALLNSLNAYNQKVIYHHKIYKTIFTRNELVTMIKPKTRGATAGN